MDLFDSSPEQPDKGRGWGVFACPVALLEQHTSIPTPCGPLSQERLEEHAGARHQPGTAVLWGCLGVWLIGRDHIVGRGGELPWEPAAEVIPAGD